MRECIARAKTLSEIAKGSVVNTEETLGGFHIDSLNYRLIDLFTSRCASSFLFYDGSCKQKVEFIWLYDDLGILKRFCVIFQTLFKSTPKVCDPCSVLFNKLIHIIEPSLEEVCSDSSKINKALDDLITVLQRVTDGMVVILVMTFRKQTTRHSCCWYNETENRRCSFCSFR